MEYTLSDLAESMRPIIASMEARGMSHKLPREKRRQAAWKEMKKQHRKYCSTGQIYHGSIFLLLNSVSFQLRSN